MSPLKLREYLAAGKPIVSVPVPEGKQFSKVVLTAEDGPGFVKAIENALVTNSPELVALRQKAVAGKTWDARVESVLDRLQGELLRISGT